jgi:ferric-dicitrate binding protein FerR (iron transport regulator)
MRTNDTTFLQRLLDDSSFVNWAKGKNKNDVEYWNKWINKHPEDIYAIETAKAIILGINFRKELYDGEKLDKEWAKVLKKIEIEPKLVKRIGAKINYKSKISIAVAAVVLLLISWSGFQFFENFNTNIHKTNFGEIIDLKLPDGTSVVLNGNSQIRYSKNHPRDIYLEGEAYFKVKSIPSTNAKFWVHTKDLKVEVLGTHFHVNTRKKKTEVVLDEGSIHLEFTNGLVKKMIPGELVSFSKDNDLLIHEKVALTPYALWRDGTYTFKEIPLKEVMQNLEYTYGVKAIFESTDLKEIVITGGVPNQNLKICINAIERATGTRIIHKNNTLLIQENLNN